MAIKPRSLTKPSSYLGIRYTLDDLENNEQFQEISERFLTSIGEQSDDVFEYFRETIFYFFSINFYDLIFWPYTIFISY